MTLSASGVLRAVRVSLVASVIRGAYPLTSGQKRLTCERSPDQHRRAACASRRQTVMVKPVIQPQFWRGFFPLVVRVWTSATGRLMVLVVVMAGRVPLAPSLPV